MNMIKKFFTCFRHFINYLYYANFSKIRNSYPFKLLGQKILDDQSETVILYKIVGEVSAREILLRAVIGSKEMIERFHPLDAAKMGSLASDDILATLPYNEKKIKFKLIKDRMLNSVHDIYSEKSDIDKNLKFKINKKFDNDKDHTSPIPLCAVENNYIYKIVGVDKTIDINQTIIIFTIFGKREGHKLPASKIVNNLHILTNFHPTEATKLGFICSGEKYFNAIERVQRITE